MNGKEESMWTIIGINVFVDVANSNLLVLKLLHCCCGG